MAGTSEPRLTKPTIDTCRWRSLSTSARFKRFKRFERFKRQGRPGCGRSPSNQSRGSGSPLSRQQEGGSRAFTGTAYVIVQKPYRYHILQDHSFEKALLFFKLLKVGVLCT